MTAAPRAAQIAKIQCVLFAVLFVVFLVLALLGIGVVTQGTTGTRAKPGVFARFPLMLSVAAVRPLLALMRSLCVLGGTPSIVAHGRLLCD